jgi:hypothetical protein
MAGTCAVLGLLPLYSFCYVHTVLARESKIKTRRAVNANCVLWVVVVVQGKNKVQNAAGGNGFTPFGGGPRLCPGYELGPAIATVFLHRLVTRFR